MYCCADEILKAMKSLDTRNILKIFPCLNFFSVCLLNYFRNFNHFLMHLEMISSENFQRIQETLEEIKVDVNVICQKDSKIIIEI